LRAAGLCKIDHRSKKKVLLRLTLIALLVLPFRRATLTGLALVALTLVRGNVDSRGGGVGAKYWRPVRN